MTNKSTTNWFARYLCLTGGCNRSPRIPDDLGTEHLQLEVIRKSVGDNEEKCSVSTWLMTVDLLDMRGRGVAGSRMNPSNTRWRSGVGKDGREVHRTLRRCRRDGWDDAEPWRQSKGGGVTAATIRTEEKDEGNAAMRGEDGGDDNGRRDPYLRTPAVMRVVRTGGAPFGSRRRRRSVRGNPRLTVRGFGRKPTERRFAR
jgi:hypothetical protein